MRYDAILFDIGDTLIEYVPSFAANYLRRIQSMTNEAFSSDGAAKIELAMKRAEYEQLTKEYNGSPRMPDEEWETMLDKAALSAFFSPEDVKHWLPAFQQQKSERPKKTVKSETVEVLKILQKRGYHMGVVSNYTASLMDFLMAQGLADFFESIIISEVVGVEKPNPRIMQLALDEMNVKPAKALYVGDHPFDVLCANLAGMDCAWLAPAEAMLPAQLPCKPTFQIQTLRDLTAVLS